MANMHHSSPSNLSLATLIYIFLPFLLSVSLTLDVIDASIGHNTLGGVRKDVDLIPQDQDILIPTVGHYLGESLSCNGEPRNPMGKSFHIPKINSAESSSSTLDRSTPITANNSIYPVSTSNRRLLESDFQSSTDFRTLNIRRYGVGISKIKNGIIIRQDGHLKEYITLNSGKLHLTAKRIRITYSSDTTCTLRMQIRHQPHVAAIETNAVSVHVQIVGGREKVVDVPFPDFPEVQPQDAISVCVLGPITLHRIEMANPPPFKSVIESLVLRYEDIDLLDDFTLWHPTEHQLPAIINDRPVYLPMDSQIYKLVSPENAQTLIQDEIRGNIISFQNSLDQFAGYWDGFVKPNRALVLQYEGFMFQQLASPGGGFAIPRGSILKVKYSARHAINRRIEVLYRKLNGIDGFLWHKIKRFSVSFTNGYKKSKAIRIGPLFFAQAFTITGHGNLTIHRIELDIPDVEQSGRFTTVVVDDFAGCVRPPRVLNFIDETTNRLGRYTEKTINGHLGLVSAALINVKGDYQVIDYRLDLLKRVPILHSSNLIHGSGIDILDGGYIDQWLDAYKGMYLSIVYSSNSTRTRKLRITGPHFRDMHVMFNTGKNITVHIPVPLFLRHFRYNPIYELRIFGPLTIHLIKISDGPPSIECVPGQSSIHLIKFLDGPPSIVNVPGQSLSDALLIDDFSCWDKIHTNSLNNGRDMFGTTGPGFITMQQQEEFLVEYFAEYTDSWNLKNLAIRITYSAQHLVTCKISLLLEKWNGPRAAYLYNVNVTKEVIFGPAISAYKTIPITSLIRNHPDIMPRIYGMNISGPMLNDRNFCSRLSLHRIELLSTIPYKDPVEPVHDVNLLLGADINYYKLAYFKNKLESLRRTEVFNLKVNRTHVWDSISKIVKSSPTELRYELKVTFDGENGQDLGGLTREFFSLVANEMSDPFRYLFLTSPGAEYALQVNPNSIIRGKVHLSSYRLIGRIIGMAILSENILGIRLVPTVYRRILSNPSTENNEMPNLIENEESDVDISEMNEHDPGMYTRLRWILDNDISDLPPMTMTVEMNTKIEWFEPTKMVTIDLIENGSKHTVTESNKKQYVREYVRWHLYRKVALQVDSLRDGVWDVIPLRTLSLLNEHELGLVLNGNSDLNLNDWMAHTSYIDYKPDDPAIILFWQCIETWDNRKRAQLLHFVTGSPRVPASGFSGLDPKFTIWNTPLTAVNMYPSASTCQRRLGLPPFPDLSAMCRQLDQASQVGMREFTFV